MSSSKAEETVVGVFPPAVCAATVGSSEDILMGLSVYSATKCVPCPLEQSGLLVPVANRRQGPQLSQHWQFFTNNS